MNPALSQSVTLENIDLFAVLRLGSLSEEERAQFSADLIGSVFEEIALEDLPHSLTPEEMTKFNAMFQQESTKDEALKFLGSKIPQLDQLIQTKLLTVKKQLIQANFQERLDINKIEREKLRQNPNSVGMARETMRNQEDRTKLEHLLQALDEDDWIKVETLAKNF